MCSNIQPSQPVVLKPEAPTTNITLPGNNNTLVAHTDNVNNNYNIMMLSGQPPRPGAGPVQQTVRFNPDFYHLIVVADGEINDTNHCLVEKSRAITEYTSVELKSKFAGLTAEAIEELKAYPAIIATENHQYGKTDEDHYAAYAMITDVKIQDNGIKVYYNVLNIVQQQRINELIEQLGIAGTKGFHELNRMHWSIKRINMVEVLREAGIPVFSI